MVMWLLKHFARGLWFAAMFLLIIAIGNALVPGQLAETAFSDLGILIVFMTMVLDYFWSFAPAPGAK